MLLEILVAVLVGFVAHKTRPAPSTFAQHYHKVHQQRTTSRGGRLFAFVDRILGSVPEQANFQFTDILVAWIVVVHGTGEVFLGIFGMWILAFSSSSASQEGQIEMGTMKGRNRNSERADAALREAHQLKAAGDFVKAAERYGAAAEEAARMDDPFSPAEHWHEASKCWKMAGNVEEQQQSLLKAADLFKKGGRSVRAAGIMKTLSKSFLDRDEKENALRYLREAAKLFEGEEDSRVWSTLLESYHLLAEMGQYLEAARGFEEEALRIVASDTILVNQSQRLLLMATLSLLSQDEATAKGKTLAWCRDYPWFVSSREGKLALELVRISLDPSADELEDSLHKLEEGYQMIATMPAWFDRLWGQKIDDLRKREYSLL